MSLKRLAADALYWTAKHAAGGYVAGQTVDDALRVCRRLAGRGWGTTICPWDKQGDSAREVFSRYQQSLERLKEEKLDCYLSVKLPSLDYDGGMIRELFEAAAEKNIRIHFDALGPESAERTLRMIERFRADFESIGFTLPARWRRSLTDAERCAALQIAVRVVKGQWPDAGVEPNVEQNFVRIVERLCGPARLIAVASHDKKLVVSTLELLAGARVRSELELLYGLPFGVAQVAAKHRTAVRVYVPYDYGYLPYAVSQVRQKPWMVWWLVRDAALAFGQRAAAAARGSAAAAGWSRAGEGA